MKTLTIQTKQRRYDIRIGSGILESTGAWLRELFPECPSVLVITDDTVAPLWSEQVMASISAAGTPVHRFVFHSGESSKTLSTVTAMLETMEELGMQRSSVVVALGGGVAGDMAGLAAALYMRGIPFIQIPTTLLAAQDSSVGGKTAVNLGAKNIVGAFWQPSLVICDCDTLSTLPEHTFADGLAEMVKHGVISDTALFEMLECGEHLTDLAACIYRSVAVKAGVVQQDERDTSLRQMLNFGHTVGHAIEQCTDFRVTHGSAVAAGMCIMARACEHEGIALSGTAARIEALLTRLGLPTGTDIPPAELYAASLRDKKRAGDGICLVRVRSLGDCYISREPVAALEKIITEGV
ncbi:MAG: 3-dehydroquinate synthase [Candidatus Heteroscillospira sp.]|jgi:3-dehydroquinate synthase